MKIFMWSISPNVKHVKLIIMDNYFFEEKLIVQIYDFFKQNSNRTSNHLTIYEFLEGKDGFLWTGEDGIGRMDVGMVKYISKICKKMESDRKFNIELQFSGRWE